MTNLWNYLQGLSLTSHEQKWLGDRLIEASKEQLPSKRRVLVFPRIPKDFKVSDEVLSMSCGPLPDEFSVEKELDNMWEEWAR